MGKLFGKRKSTVSASIRKAKLEAPKRKYTERVSKGITQTPENKRPVTFNGTSRRLEAGEKLLSHTLSSPTVPQSVKNQALKALNGTRKRAKLVAKAYKKIGRK